MNQKDLENKGIQTDFQISILPWGQNRKVDFQQSGLEEEKIENWPMVYILTGSNGYQREAYVGQTTSILKRIGRQHSRDSEKNRFNQVQIIFNESFNESVISDYESRLIQLLSAGEFRLLNRNNGLQKTNYFQKSYYDELFPYLWEELRKKRIVHHTLYEIENSDLFKYSPYKELNKEQLAAVQQILKALKENEEEGQPVVVQGLPGTGKTVLAMYLLKYLKDQKKNRGKVIKLLMPIASLRDTLRKVADTVPGLQKEDILDPYDLADYEKIDILLVDEAHRLETYKNHTRFQYLKYQTVSKKLGLDYNEDSQYEWVLKKAVTPIFFFDQYQIVRPNNPSLQKVKTLLGESFDHSVKLSEQMRVRGGEKYINYILSILAGTQTDKQEFENYSVFLHEDFDDFYQSFRSDLRRAPLTRMIAGYAWKWNSKKNKKLPDFTFGSVNLQWNSYREEWVLKGLDNPKIANEVGCIHTIQGYDLENAYVIIGDDLIVDGDTGELKANKESYYDHFGKTLASKQELDTYIKKVYFILLTRGIKSTHIYIPNPETKKYFQKFFSTPAS